MIMKGYSCEIPERCAKARLEDVNASYKDLSEVCGVLRKKKADWALEFLGKASKGEVPVLYSATAPSSGGGRGDTLSRPRR
jgi:ribosomal protein L22